MPSSRISVGRIPSFDRPGKLNGTFFVPPAFPFAVDLERFARVIVFDDGAHVTNRKWARDSITVAREIGREADMVAIRWPPAWYGRAATKAPLVGTKGEAW